MGLIKVVCGIIYKDDKILLCRKKVDKPLGGYWEFPGGKVEFGESNEETLSRELMEELGMKVVVKSFFKSNIHFYENISIELIAYNCQFLESNYQLVDHDAYEWLDINDLNNYKLAPADIPLVNELLRVNLTRKS